MQLKSKILSVLERGTLKRIVNALNIEVDRRSAEAMRAALSRSRRVAAEVRVLAGRGHNCSRRTSARTSALLWSTSLVAVSSTTGRPAARATTRETASRPSSDSSSAR